MKTVNLNDLTSDEAGKVFANHEVAQSILDSVAIWCSKEISFAKRNNGSQEYIDVLDKEESQALAIKGSLEVEDTVAVQKVFDTYAVRLRMLDSRTPNHGYALKDWEPIEFNLALAA